MKNFFDKKDLVAIPEIHQPGRAFDFRHLNNFLNQGLKKANFFQAIFH